MYNRLVLVTGSGRSGTSLFSGLLKALGGHVPQPEVAADETNPRGFGEPQWVVDLHNDLLRRAGVETSDGRPSAWAKTAEIGREREVQRNLEKWLRAEFDHGDHVIVKDPRLLWFIPLWSRAGETVATPCFTTVLRHPLEVTKSKQTYYGGVFGPNARTVGWLNTMLFTERATRGNRRAFVRYEDLLADPLLTVSKVDEALDLALTGRAQPHQMRAAAQLVDPSLRRSSNASWESLGVNDQIAEMAEETWKLFDRAADPDDVDPFASEFDELRTRYLDLYSFAESIAQWSVVAAQKRRPARAGAGNVQAAAPVARKVARKVKRKVKRTAHEAKSRLNRPEGA